MSFLFFVVVLQRVNLQRIASAIELEFINPEMVPFVLPNMFLIAVIEPEFD